MSLLCPSLSAELGHGGPRSPHPTLLGAVWLSLGTRKERGCSSSCLRAPCGAEEPEIRHAHIPTTNRAKAARCLLALLRPWSCCCRCCHHHRNFGSARGLSVPLPW